MKPNNKEIPSNQVDVVFALPGWLLTCLLVKFLKNHAWHNNMVPLKKWTMNRTSLMRQFDIVFWVCLIGMTFAIYSLITR